VGARGWLNLALAAAVAGLAAVLWLEPGKETPPPKPKLLAIDKAGVRRIVVERPGREALELQRRGDHWWLVRPFEVPAARFRAESILGLAGAESESRFEAAEAELARYGLEPPKAVVRFDDAATVAVGGTDPIDLRRYVRVDGQRTVHLVRDTFYTELAADAAELVSTRLIPPGWEPVEIAVPGLTVRRGGEGRWEPDAAHRDASADALAAFVDAWRTRRALWVERLDKAGRAALARAPTVRLRLRRAGTGREDGDEALLELRYRLVTRESDKGLVREDLGLVWRITPAAAGELLELREPEPPADARKSGEAAPAGGEGEAGKGGSRADGTDAGKDGLKDTGAATGAGR